MTIIKRNGANYAQEFMAWMDGVDAMLKPTPDSPLPHVLVHVAREVITPLGSCAAGMLLLNPDLKEVPDLFCFIAEDPEIGGYFGPKIFAGTPFEQAPVFTAAIRVNSTFPGKVVADIHVDALIPYDITLEMSNFDPAQYYDRPGGMPFRQNVIEAKANTAKFIINGRDVSQPLPPEGIAGGLPACYSPAGLYIR